MRVRLARSIRSLEAVKPSDHPLNKARLSALRNAQRNLSSVDEGGLVESVSITRAGRFLVVNGWLVR